jgi:hypothetical protein
MVQLLRSTSIGCAALFMATLAPAIADEYVTNLGPVGPNEPIIAVLGSTLAMVAPPELLTAR